MLDYYDNNIYMQLRRTPIFTAPPAVDKVATFHVLLLTVTVVILTVLTYFTHGRPCDTYMYTIDFLN